MNNEEKILTILEQIQSEQKQTNQRLGKLEAGQANLEAGQASLEVKVAVIEQDIKQIKEDTRFLRSVTDHAYKDIGILGDRIELLKAR